MVSYVDDTTDWWVSLSQSAAAFPYLTSDLSRIRIVIQLVKYLAQINARDSSKW